MPPSYIWEQMQRLGSPRPTTISTSRVWSALGIKGGELPSMQLSAYQPVMVMADFSRSLTSEPIEARGLFAGVIDNVSSFHRAFLEFQAVAGGGVIVERLVCDVTTAFGGNALCVDMSPGPFWAGAPVGKLDIGGAATRSLLFARHSSDAPSGNEQIISMPANVPSDLSEFRLYIPSGWWLEVFCYATDTPMRVTMVWRELQEPIGTP